MEVTGVKIFTVIEKRVKAYAAIVFDDCFIVRDFEGNTWRQQAFCCNAQ
jgi:DNA-binding cell septation regulator SpoVG